MGKLTSLLALCLVLSANALWAGEPDEASAKGDTAESTLKKKRQVLRMVTATRNSVSVDMENGSQF